MSTIKLIPSILVNNNCYKSGRIIKPKGIVVHSTGCNNPNLNRYCVNEEHLGKSSPNNWNQPRPDKQQKCVHAFIGYDKDNTVQIAQTLPWNMRCWGCGKGDKGSYNDSHIQFEICEDNLSNPTYFYNCYNKAVELCVFLCKEFDISPDNIVCHSEAHSLGYASNHADVMHWFPKYNKSMNTFREEVRAKLANNQTPEVEPVNIDERIIWDVLMEHFNNPYGVAGLMGNLKAESNLRANNLQNTYSKKFNVTDELYTELVDDELYPNFVYDKAGYGLAQWTYWSRKQNLYNFLKSKNLSIGDLRGQLEFLIEELKKYTPVYKVLKSATSVKEASDIVLTQYEKPADQSDNVKEKRCRYGLEFYDKYNTRPTDTNLSVQAGTKEDTPFRVKVLCDLNIRKGASTDTKVVGTITNGGVYTIVQVIGHWGKLKSGKGWISILNKYVKRL